MDEQELGDKANADLKEMYEKVLPKWKALHSQLSLKNECLSIPCFVDVRPEYFKASKRVIFVGQETHGWYTEWKKSIESLTVSEITQFYRNIRPTLLKKYRSPYWQAIRRISNGLAIAEPESSIIFTNIFPCDVNKKQASLDLHNTFREWNILPRELDILRPNAVIFLCGPNYAWNFEPFFKLPASRLSNATPVLPYTPTGVSWKGILSYHPNYLRRTKRWGMLDEIVNLASTIK